MIKKKTGIDINSICCDYFMTNSLSRNSKSFKEENLEILNFLIKESCPLNNIKIIDLPLMGEEGLKKKQIADDYINLLFGNAIVGNAVGVSPKLKAQQLLATLIDIDRV